MSRSSPEYEPAAVPAEDNAYGAAVSDEEFAEWVKRSQEDTDRVLEDWDAGVEFDQRVAPDGPEDVLIDAEIVDEDREPPAAVRQALGRVQARYAERRRAEAGHASFHLRAPVQIPLDPQPLFGPGPPRPQTDETFEARHAFWRRQMDERYGRTPDGLLGPHPGDGVSWQREDGERDLYAEWHAELEHRREVEAARGRLEEAGVLIVEGTPEVGLASTLGLILPLEGDQRTMAWTAWARQTFGL